MTERREKGVVFGVGPDRHTKLRPEPATRRVAAPHEHALLDDRWEGGPGGVRGLPPQKIRRARRDGEAVDRVDRSGEPLTSLDHPRRVALKLVPRVIEDHRGGR